MCFDIYIYLCFWQRYGAIPAEKLDVLSVNSQSLPRRAKSDIHEVVSTHIQRLRVTDETRQRSSSGSVAVASGSELFGGGDRPVIRTKSLTKWVWFFWFYSNFVLIFFFFWKLFSSSSSSQYGIVPPEKPIVSDPYNLVPGSVVGLLDVDDENNGTDKNGRKQSKRDGSGHATSDDLNLVSELARTGGTMLLLPERNTSSGKLPETEPKHDDDSDEAGVATYSTMIINSDDDDDDDDDVDHEAVESDDERDEIEQLANSYQSFSMDVNAEMAALQSTIRSNDSSSTHDSLAYVPIAANYDTYRSETPADEVEQDNGRNNDEFDPSQYARRPGPPILVPNVAPAKPERTVVAKVTLFFCLLLFF